MRKVLLGVEDLYNALATLCAKEGLALVPDLAIYDEGGEVLFCLDATYDGYVVGYLPELAGRRDHFSIAVRYIGGSIQVEGFYNPAPHAANYNFPGDMCKFSLRKLAASPHRSIEECQDE